MTQPAGTPLIIQRSRALLAVRTVGPSTIWPVKLIVIDTVAQHLENRFRLHASCPCGRGDWLDLAHLVELGYGDVPAAQLGKRLRCRACGKKGLALQCHGPWSESERARELERLEAERREKVRPFRQRKPRR